MIPNPFRSSPVTAHALRYLALLFSGVLFFSPLGVDAAQKVALVIGNGNYAGDRALPNPVHDAEDIAQSLRDLNFKVILCRDADHRTMDEALQKFQQSIGAGDFAFFFYAGHGVQVNAVNYLVPINANLDSSSDAKYHAVNAEEVKSAMEESGAKLKVLVLDCCRDNPFTRSWASAGTRSASAGGKAGLAPMTGGKGTLLAYSAATDAVAFDGNGARNSPFSANLVRMLRSRPAGGLDIVDLFRRTGEAVEMATHNQQEPWLNFQASTRFDIIEGDGSTPPPVEVLAPTVSIPLPAPATPAPVPKSTAAEKPSKAATTKRSSTTVKKKAPTIRRAPVREEPPAPKAPTPPVDDFLEKSKSFDSI